MKPLTITGERLLLVLDWFAYAASRNTREVRQRFLEATPRNFADDAWTKHFIEERFPGLVLFFDVYEGSEIIPSVRVLLRTNPHLLEQELNAGSLLKRYLRKETEGSLSEAYRNGYRYDLERFVRAIASGEITEADLMPKVDAVV